MDRDDSGMNRRQVFTRLAGLGGLGAGAAGLGVWLKGRARRPEEPTVAAPRRNFTVPADPTLPTLVIASGDDPRLLVRRAVGALGGMRRFVSRGDVVVVKPNVAWDRVPEQGADTNPAIVEETVRMCVSAGASRVIVTDVSSNEPRRCFERSGIGAAARSAGAEIILPEERRFRQVDLRGDVLGVWPVLEPFLIADKVINIPIAKHHSLTGVTLGMKNWYGILGGARHRLHQRIHESLVDLADFMRPTLTIIDAWRVLLRGGPTGGNLEDVALKKTVIAGTDAVAVDAYAAREFWDWDPERLLYLKLASERGLGNLRLDAVPTATV